LLVRHDHLERQVALHQLGSDDERLTGIEHFGNVDREPAFRPSVHDIGGCEHALDLVEHRLVAYECSVLVGRIVSTGGRRR
jgi:hypothetical protein